MIRNSIWYFGLMVKTSFWPTGFDPTVQPGVTVDWVKHWYIECNRQTDRQTNSLRPNTGVCSFFFQLNLLLPYSLCSQGDNLSFLFHFPRSNVLTTTWLESLWEFVLLYRTDLSVVLQNIELALKTAKRCAFHLIQKNGLNWQLSSFEQC